MEDGIGGVSIYFFFNDTATTEIYTLSLHDALPIFYVAGHEDLMKNQFAVNKRKGLDEITRELQRGLPLILMDHQPFLLELAEKNGVDLQLSGHTHHGQLWPFNYITKLVYEKSRGYLQKGNTHYYVSCGVGGWGPPVRTVSRPEIVHIKLNFD